MCVLVCSYFPLFDVFTPMYQRAFARVGSSSSSSSASSSPSSHPLLVHFLAGNTAGAVSGVVLNQLTAIKYASWESDRGGFFVTARSMWREGGVQPFMKGIVPTVIRDTIFGGVFALSKEGCGRALNHIRQRAQQQSAERRKSSSAAPAQQSTSAVSELDAPSSPPAAAAPVSFARSFSRWSERHVGTIDFVSSLIAGALGTIASSPFNFVRNIKYGWPAKETPPTASVILSQLLQEAAKKGREEGAHSSLSYLQERLRIGWGTARVAVGMAIGYEIYELVKHALDNTAHTRSSTRTNATQQPHAPHPTPLPAAAAAPRTAQRDPSTAQPLTPRRTVEHASSAVGVPASADGASSSASASSGRFAHALLELPDSASPRPVRHQTE